MSKKAKKKWIEEFVVSETAAARKSVAEAESAVEKARNSM
jgi:hypothetical protein